MRQSEYIVIPESFWINPNLSWIEKCVMIEMHSLSGSGGYRKPLSKIAAGMNMPKQQVKVIVGDLKAKNAITSTIGDDGIETYHVNLNKKNYDANINTCEITEDSPVDKDSIDYDEILEEWKRTNPTLRQPKVFTPKMRKQLRTLLKNNRCSIEDFLKGFKAISTSAFLNGKNDRGWTARLDWLVSDSNGCWQKLIAGAYHQTTNERISLDEIFSDETKPTDNYYR